MEAKLAVMPICVLSEMVLLYTRRIESLKRFKDDAKEVNTGFECGILLENFNDLKEAISRGVMRRESFGLMGLLIWQCSSVGVFMMVNFVREE